MIDVTFPPPGTCDGCKSRDKLIKQLTRELTASSREREVLADLAVKNQDKAAKLQRKLERVTTA